MSSRRAAFLDRDGTIIDDVDYIAHADHVRLRPGAAEAIRLLNSRDVRVVVITNQSGIARGKFTVSDYQSVRDRVAAELAMHDARIDATYYCPHHPDVTGACDCRKPATLLFDTAIAELGIDGGASMFAGDRLRDVLPSLKYGGRAFLVRAPSTPPDELERASEAHAEIASSLLDAVGRFFVRSDP